MSVRTICRRLAEYDLSVSAIYTDISDDELDSVIQSLIHEFPSSGYRMTDGTFDGVDSAFSKEDLEEPCKGVILMVWY